jgi:homocitrate synthase NifV
MSSAIRRPPCSLAADLQLPANLAELRAILDRVREHAVTHKGLIAAETLTAIWRDVCARPFQTHT